MDNRTYSIKPSKQVVHLDEISRLNQIHSPLLRLPAELRNSIFAYALGASKIERCTGYSCQVCRKLKILSGSPKYVTCHFEGGLGILSTCRQVYAESKLLPFKLNTVSSRVLPLSEPSYDKFAAWQRNAITSVQIHAKMSIKSAAPNLGVDFLLQETGRLKGLERVTFVWYIRKKAINSKADWPMLRQSMLENCRDQMARLNVEIHVVTIFHSI
ncbi:hypothetical protein HBH56_164800 [Parastagonospora nodorum]|uniref:Uncharacterized protein n=1 Tax=Phaeosphaeria nodorum (strain SN15 / ATCC MYA-4574 / FGSC 10173) TaxID=321614 RepID=A0A7U2F506_PHANO|nr:hypothetical protein HBH56_164800 [Parastagonospora nodorum]QRC98437.1 hypothetical protein JI435_435700 [Parastagonospora nodorum SN15]KAH3936401.1 hypothetical protein HBH54_027890 [Parastagonospora nodorum]KAH3968640.1 hypothetical protein HBH51_126580 [Parastagonospora nodorum]KAH3989740.1 hypothetical protein HBH52_015320 [Parastagonospora nodorum]